MTLKLLIADDDARVLQNVLRPIFAKLGQFEISLAVSPKECRERLNEHKYDIVLLDLSFTPFNKEGVDLISVIKEFSPESEIIMLTSFTDRETIDDCMGRGAGDYISKDHLEDSDSVTVRIQAAVERHQKKTPKTELGLKLAKKVGAAFASKAMQNIFSEIADVRGQPRMHVLITGETGVGKELIARAIARDDEGAPFFPVNSSCFGKELLEGELFGHERGSFTGADRLKIGLFESANGGDIFLDEIATLTLDHQAKLLRVLQQGEFRRIGGNKILKTTARVIAATNENLEEMVRQGKFREDLLQRLQRYYIHIPPLSDRKEDIPLIVRAVIEKSDKPEIKITDECLAFLVEHRWQRNVRQLEDCVLSMVMKSNGKILTIGDLPKNIFSSPPVTDNRALPETVTEAAQPSFDLPETDFESAVNEFSGAYIRNAMSRLKGPITIDKLAAAVGMSRSALHRRLAQYGIDIAAERKKESQEKDCAL